MTRAGVFLTVVLAAASVGVYAQDSNSSANAPPQVGTQQAQQGNADVARSSENQGSQQSAAPAKQQDAAATPGGTGTGTHETASADGNNQQLPQTSTILPLLGLIGLGSLVAGLFARR